MTIEEAKRLIERGVSPTHKRSVWADLGCGNGTFTQSLAQLLKEDSIIYAIDRTEAKDFPRSSSVEIKFLKSDFENVALPFSKIDGILMANSLHYIKDKASLLQKIKTHLRDNGKLIIVEYDTDKSNTWVPYPVTFNQINELLTQSGFKHIEKIGKRPSIYGPQKMYACVAEA